VEVESRDNHLRGVSIVAVHTFVFPALYHLLISSSCSDMGCSYGKTAHKIRLQEELLAPIRGLAMKAGEVHRATGSGIEMVIGHETIGALHGVMTSGTELVNLIDMQGGTMIGLEETDAMMTFMQAEAIGMTGTENGTEEDLDLRNDTQMQNGGRGTHIGGEVGVGLGARRRLEGVIKLTRDGGSNMMIETRTLITILPSAVVLTG
jgi:hypothetical protein